MPEPQPNPEPETPPAVETPPVSPGSEETPIPAETPAPSTSPGEETPPAAPAGEKTAGQIAADKAHFQTKSQDLMKQLAALTGDEAPPEPEKPAVAPTLPAPEPAQPPPAGDQDINEYLRDNPLAAVSALGDHLIQHIDKAFDNHRKRLENDVEQREANRVLTRFCTDNDVAPEQLKEAHQYVKSLGVTGRPAAITSMIAKEIISQKLINSGQEVVTDAAAKAAAAAKTQALTIQPDGSQPASPAKPTTPDEIVRSKFAPSPQKANIDKILGRTA